MSRPGSLISPATVAMISNPRKVTKTVTRRGDDSARSRGCEVGQVGCLDEEQPQAGVDEDDQKFRADHEVLCAAGLLGSVVVDSQDEHEAGEPDENDKRSPVEERGRLDDVLAEPDHVEGAGEHQAGPHPPTDDTPEESPQPAVDVVVTPAGDGHPRRQFGQRDGREQRDEPSDGEGDGTRGAGPLGRDGWKDEDSGTDHRPAAERHRLYEPERPVKLALRHVVGPTTAVSGYT